LPVTSTRKVRRGEIVDWLQKPGRPAAAAAVDERDNDSSRLVRLLSQATRRAALDIGPDTELVSGLGLDSLARVELAVAVERQMGVLVSDEAMAEVSTVGELERLIAGAGTGRPSPPPATWPFGRLATPARSLGQNGILFPLLERICSPLKVSGQNHLKRLNGPVILVANHASHLDASLVLRTLPRTLRRSIAVAAAQDYFFSSLWRALPAQLFLGAFPLARTGAILPSMELCGRLADRGRSLVVFPEGTRAIDGRVQEFKAGIGLLARELRLPVVPIGISGTDARLPKGRLLPDPGPVQVRFGTPVTRDPEESDQEFANRLRQVVIGLLD
jgi:long-chain acyl-CoA synthetase